MPKGAEYKKELKSRFSNGSFDSFDDLEKLSLLLCYGTASGDVRPDAAELLDRFGSFRAVINATPERLSSIGISEATTTFVLLLKECAGLYLYGSLIGKEKDSYPDLIDFLHLTLSSERVEKFLAVYLDSNDRFLRVETLHEGTINRTAVYPRKAIELALLHKASSVIFVHNHPSGDPTPSCSDNELGIALERAASAIDLRVLDHIVIAEGGHFSARHNGSS